MSGKFYPVPTPSYLGENKTCYVGDYTRSYSILSLTKEAVELNPEILPFVKDYYVSVHPFVVSKYNGQKFATNNMYLKKCIFESPKTMWNGDVGHTKNEDILTQIWDLENILEFKYTDIEYPQFVFTNNNMNYIQNHLNTKAYIAPEILTYDNIFTSVVLTIEFNE